MISRFKSRFSGRKVVLDLRFGGPERAVAGGSGGGGRLFREALRGSGIEIPRPAEAGATETLLHPVPGRCGEGEAGPDGQL
jgi:hypothetical protein